MTLTDRERELLAWAASIIQDAQERGVYGEVVVRMEAGRVVHVDRREGCKPPKG